MSNALFKKSALKLDDTLSHSVDGTLPLMNALDEPGGRTQFALNVLACLLCNVTILAQGLAVKGAYPQLRHAVFVQKDDKFIFHFVHENVGTNILDFLLIILPAGFGIQPCYNVNGLAYLLRVPAGGLNNGVVVPIFQVAQVIRNYVNHQVIFKLQTSCLNQQTFLQVPGCHPQWIKSMNMVKHLFHQRFVTFCHLSYLGCGGLQITIPAQITKDHGAHFFLGLIQV